MQQRFRVNACRGIYATSKTVHSACLLFFFLSAELQNNCQLEHSGKLWEQSWSELSLDDLLALSVSHCWRNGSKDFHSTDARVSKRQTWAMKKFNPYSFQERRKEAFECCLAAVQTHQYPAGVRDGAGLTFCRRVIGLCHFQFSLFVLPHTKRTSEDSGIEGDMDVFISTGRMPVFIYSSLRPAPVILPPAQCEITCLESVLMYILTSAAPV